MVRVQRHSEEWPSADKFWGRAFCNLQSPRLYSKLGVRASASTNNFSEEVSVLLPKYSSSVKACSGVLSAIQRQSCPIQIISSLLAADRSKASPAHSNSTTAQTVHTCNSSGTACSAITAKCRSQGERHAVARGVF